MNRRHLQLSAAILTTLIIAVGINALDRLPGGLRIQIDSERAALASAQKQVQSAQAAVGHEVQSDAALFRSLPASQTWPAQFQQSAATLQSAARDMDELTRLEKDGHHRDESHVESLLSDERSLRASALSQASGIQTEAARWIGRKQHLPEAMRQMERDYQAVHAFDLQPLTTAVQRAQADWPEKKGDLASRLAAVTGIVAHSDSLWQATAAARRQAGSGDAAGVDLGALFAAGDELQASAAALPKKAAELQTLTGQLYDSWDKVLVDMEVRGIGANRAWDQKIRTVRVHNGETTSEERWVDVSQATYDGMRNDLGMAIEHKPAGKYDSEAEHVAQPAGFAYMAPPSQGSNQYGYWDHRDGHSFWVWYGQYALLRDLLFNHSYRPLPRDEWEEYRSYRGRGQTYYGHDAEAGTPKYGSNGTATQERYRNFRESPFASKPGGFRESPYASREAEPRSFGRNARPAEPPEHSFHPAPKPSFRPPMGGGRRFGGRRR